MKFRYLLAILGVLLLLGILGRLEMEDEERRIAVENAVYD